MYMSRYYVQVIAANYLKNLVDQPVQMALANLICMALRKMSFIVGFASFCRQ